MGENMVVTSRERTRSSRSEAVQFSQLPLCLCLSCLGFDLTLQSNKWKRTGDSQQVEINMQQYFLPLVSTFIHSKLPQHIPPYRMGRRTVYAKQMYLFPLKRKEQPLTSVFRTAYLRSVTLPTTRL